MTIKTKNPTAQRGTFLINWGTGHSGFTLVELIVVCAILGLLATIAIPAFETQVKSAKNARAKGDIRTIDKEIQAYFIENNKLPDDLTKLNKGVFVDGWGRPYVYSKTPIMENSFGDLLNTDYDLYSEGMDSVGTPAYNAVTSPNDIVRASDGSYVGLRADF
jgi:general secretion pathway protein G